MTDSTPARAWRVVLDRIEGLQKDWIWHGGTVWLVGWWRND